jgi:hypothetical protein
LCSLAGAAVNVSFLYVSIFVHTFIWSLSRNTDMYFKKIMSEKWENIHNFFMFELETSSNLRMDATCTKSVL